MKTSLMNDEESENERKEGGKRRGGRGGIQGGSVLNEIEKQLVLNSFDPFERVISPFLR